MLERLGVAVEVANNGREAVESWSRDRFDLILMDCQMPVADGYEATRGAGQATAASTSSSRDRRSAS